MPVFLAIFTLFFAATPAVPAHHIVIAKEAPSAEDCNGSGPLLANIVGQQYGAQAVDWACVTFKNPADKPT